MLRQRISLTAITGALVLLIHAVTPARLGDAATLTQPTSVEQSSDLLIYDSSGTTLLGRAHYTVAQHGESMVIDGRNTYIDGQYDVEHDTMRAVGDELPRMVSYGHSFYDAQGAPLIIARADALSGKCSCAKYKNGNGTIETADLEFPPDTYAGAGVLVPIADQFRRGEATDVDIHVFDCADGPRILTLHADLARALWGLRPHDGELAKADARPVFGWFNVFLKPFVPKIRLWFDPLRNFAFVGGMLARYYRGPEVLLVSIAPPSKSEPNFERPHPPTLTAPHESAPSSPLSSVAR